MMFRYHSRTLFACLCLLTMLAPTWAQKKKGKKNTDEPAKESVFTKETFAGLKWRSIGPALMSGRIADVVIHPEKRAIRYVAVGSGGVWKTTNAGTTWNSIFDGQGAYSIGCITLDPSSPNTVWVGTGENVGGRHVAYGDGVYRSIDGGETWENMGLKNSEHIGNIIVHPNNSDIIYVAAQGPLWSADGDRGLFKSEDGGKTWNKLLGEGPYTGVNEVAMDPSNPEVLYAATHQRYRNVAALINGGPGSGIHKSSDGGNTWRELTKGLPKEDKGKIGLAISPIDPNIVYATVELAHRGGGFYRSADAGESWEKRSDYISGGTGPHYYQELFASPHQLDHVYQMDNYFRHTLDGGKTWERIYEDTKHVDNHAMAFDPKDPNYLMVGTDGGLYESWDRGQSWKYHDNLPIAQFYKIAVDYDEPFYNIYGGTQDNNTQGGPSRTDTVHGVRNSDWFITLTADGHQPAVDYTNPNIIYSEWQQGNLVRYDRVTGEMIHIQPQPGADDGPERFNWDAPILISPHEPKRLYYASHRVWRSEDRGDSWAPISGDLTRDGDRLKAPMMGRVQSYDAVWDLFAMSNFHTLTSLSESPVEEGLLYAGSDDGLISISEDGGANWRNIAITKLPGMPEAGFINDIKADLHDANTVYVALDNHKSGDFKPYLYKSVDRGKSWTSIASNLPDRHLIWRLVQDHVKPELMFVGTEFGVYFTIDSGTTWTQLSGGFPTISVRDLAIQKRENDLVAGTFGRGILIMDDYTPLRHLTEAGLKSGITLFPVRDAAWYVPKRVLGSTTKAFQGDDFYSGDNPPFGAVFTYYVAEDLKTRKETRQENEKKLIEDGKDTPYPGWDGLREEHLEDPPTIVLTVRDNDGNLIRRVEGPAKKGFHRVAWDMRYPTVDAWSPNPSSNFFGDFSFLLPPGTYQVSLAKRHDGKLEDMGEPQNFELKPIYESTLKGMSYAERDQLLGQVRELQRVESAAGSLARDLDRRLDAIKQTLYRSSARADLRETVLKLEGELFALRAKLGGDQLKGGLGEVHKTAISNRLFHINLGNMYSTYGPTKGHMENVAIIREQLTEVSSQLNDLNENKLPELEKQLEAAGVPWTPGRPVPKP